MAGPFNCGVPASVSLVVPWIWQLGPYLYSRDKYT